MAIKFTKEELDDMIWAPGTRDPDLEIENFYNLLNTGYKVIYDINRVGQTFIEDVVKSYSPSAIISSIKTGRAGLELLTRVDSQFKSLCDWDKMLDPVFADESVNPIMISGWRLSSYSFLIQIGDELIKLVPVNRNKI